MMAFDKDKARRGIEALEVYRNQFNSNAPTATGTIADIERARTRATYEQTKKLSRYQAATSYPQRPSHTGPR